MSVKLDCAIRTAEAALNNLIQIARDEDVAVDLDLQYTINDDLGKSLIIDRFVWSSSSSDC